MHGRQQKLHLYKSSESLHGPAIAADQLAADYYQPGTHRTIVACEPQPTGDKHFIQPLSDIQWLQHLCKAKHQQLKPPCSNIKRSVFTSTFTQMQCVALAFYVDLQRCCNRLYANPLSIYAVCDEVLDSYCPSHCMLHWTSVAWTTKYGMAVHVWPGPSLYSFWLHV